MRVPRIPVLLLTATCCLSGCCSFQGNIATDHEWVGSKGGVVQHGPISQKGVLQKGGVVQKGHVHQKGGPYLASIQRNLWNRFEPSGCCGGWDPILGSCDACGVCGGACQGHTPAQHMKHMLTCASGCGDIYWGDWISYPPDNCDPCDDWGNWTGPNGCCGPSHLETLATGWSNLWGYRTGGGKGSKGKGSCTSCGGKGGCDTCGDESAPYYDLPVEAGDEGAGAGDGDEETVPTPEIETGNRTHLTPRASSGFRLRSARLTR